MTRGKASPKVAKKKGGGKNQPSSNGQPAAGKKRKKKGGGVKGVPPLPLLRSGGVSDGMCESNSSLDNKPSSKQGRFDCSSSERMSTDHTSSSVMDTGTASPPHTLTTAHSSHHHTPTAHSSHRQTPAAHSSHHQTPTAHSSHHHTPTAHLDCSPTSGMDTPRGMLCEGEISHDVSLSTYRSHDSDMSHDTVPQSSPGGHSPRADTDRWGHVCSDEEQERRRLEVYKENRRKRYESALEEKLSLLPRTDYYSADSH